MTMATTSFISGRIRTTPVQRLSLNECEILFNSSVAYQLLKVATFRDTKACDDSLFISDPNALDRPCSPNELYKSVQVGIIYFSFPLKIWSLVHHTVFTDGISMTHMRLTIGQILQIG